MQYLVKRSSYVCFEVFMESYKRYARFYYDVKLVNVPGSFGRELTNISVS